MSDLVSIDLPRQRPSGPARPNPADVEAPRPRLPSWLKVKLPGGEAYSDLKRLVREGNLHTVCEEASCPNIGECWDSRELTLMILGDTCTRSCGFCDVATGRPSAVDRDEPRRVAEALSRLGLRHAVITSVDRDELPDGGASIWAETITRVREACPGTTLEVLVPDFRGRLDHVDVVLDARPHVFAHNTETVPRLYPRVRPQARYEWTLSVLRHAKARGAITKTGVMLGLGETREEVLATIRDFARVGVDIVTLGQYLRPSRRHLPVARFIAPEEFTRFASEGRDLGIGHVEAGPLVRSSYKAGDQARRLGASATALLLSCLAVLAAAPGASADTAITGGGAADTRPVETPATATTPPAPGWSGPVPMPATRDCAIEMPRVPLRVGVSILLSRPQEYPRPEMDCVEPRDVPLLVDSRLLERIEGTGGGEATLGWTPRLGARRRGSDVVVVDVDVLPHRRAAAPGSNPLQEFVSSEPPIYNPQPQRWRMDPARLAGGASPENEPPPPPVPPRLRILKITDIEADGLVVGAGGTWMSVAIGLDPPQASWYRLGEPEIFGAGGRLIVAPTPRHARAMLELLVVDRGTLAVTSLGRPAPPGASWRQELSDVRENAAMLEAILLERDPSPLGAAGGPTWGAVLRLAEGRWAGVALFNLPDDVPQGAVRFDPADPTRLLLVEGDRAWTHALP